MRRWTTALRDRRVRGLALGVFYLVVLAWQSPHLVHHALDPGLLPPYECAFAAAADHGPAVSAPAPATIAPPPVRACVVAVAAAFPPDADRSPAAARDPPRHPRLIS